MFEKVVISPAGRLANQLIQYLSCSQLAGQLSAELAVLNLEGRPSLLPKVGINLPTLSVSELRPSVTLSSQLWPTKALLRVHKLPGKFHVVATSMGARLDQLPTLEESRRLLRLDQCCGCDESGASLVMHVRLGDIASGSHQGYQPMPISWFTKVQSDTSSTPMFVGELDASEYSQRIHRQFPSSLFSSSDDPLIDLCTIWKAQKIAVSLSTFSWLAAWLSRAEQIFLPIAGLFDPSQRPEIDLLPTQDSRYIFMLPDTEDNLKRFNKRKMPFGREVVFKEASRADLENLSLRTPLCFWKTKSNLSLVLEFGLCFFLRRRTSFKRGRRRTILKGILVKSRTLVWLSFRRVRGERG